MKSCVTQKPNKSVVNHIGTFALHVINTLKIFNVFFGEISPDYEHIKKTNIMTTLNFAREIFFLNQKL